MRTLLLASLLAAVGCFDDKPDDSGAPEYEGDVAGECSDGADNDRDGLYDCDDPDCAGSPDCDEDTGETTPTEVEGDAEGECDDGDDNDGDGLTDCDDPGCEDDEDCAETTEVEGDQAGECSDGADNDGDGLTDCDDPGCDEDDRCTNEPPSAPAAVLSPTEPTTLDDLECTITVDAVDPDGDAISYSYTWMVDGVVAGSSGDESWSSERTSKGQTIQCLVYASDGLDTSDSAETDTVTIVNSAPTVDDATIDPAEPFAGDALTCSWEGWDDPDHDDDASTVAWTVDGTAAGTGTVLVADLAHGQDVTCSVTAHDGEDEGNTVSTSVTVGNSAPTLSSAWLTPTDADILDTLTCTPGSASDPDGESVSYTYGWTVDAADIGHGDTTLELDLTYEGSLVHCTVTPSDGTEDGEAVDSNTVTVLSGPVMEVDTESWDFGLVEVDCEDSVPVTVSNTGTSDLLVSTASLTGDSELSHDLPVPTVVAAGGSASFEASFAPADEGSYAASLLVSSNDPRGDATLDLAGESDWASISESFTASIDEPELVADVILAVDRSGSMNDDITGLTAGLVGMTDALLEAGVDYQIAATVEDDGCINGSDIWIDDSYSATDAETVMETMVNLGGTYGSNTERAFMLLEAALTETVSGGCNEGLVREGASLHLVGVSDEPDQSVSSYSTYLTTFETYVDSNDLLYVHGIGGDNPSGCGSASAYTGIYEATVATGGTLVSICTTDWETTMATMGDAMVVEVAEDASFELTSTPSDESTIVVTVEGTDISGSWTWDASTGTIIIDASVIEDGDAVEISYEGSGC